MSPQVLPSEVRIPRSGEVRQLTLFPPEGAAGATTTKPRLIDPIDSPLLRDQISEFQVHLARVGKAFHSLAAARRDLEQLATFLGDRRTDQIALDDLRQFMQSLQQVRANGIASTRRKIATLKAFFRFVRSRGLLEGDPSAALTYPAPLEREVEALTESESTRLLAAAEVAGHRALFLVMLDAGLKREELLALRRSDLTLVDSASGSLIVRHGLDAKRIRARSVLLTARLASALADRRAEPGSDESLFGLSTRGVDYVVREAAQRAGAPRRGKLTPQRLRDTFAVRWLAARLVGEVAAADAAARPELEARHDRELAELLGLAPNSLAIDRYRRAARLERDRAEAAPLPNL